MSRITPKKIVKKLLRRLGYSAENTRLLLGNRRLTVCTYWILSEGAALLKAWTTALRLIDVAIKYSDDYRFIVIRAKYYYRLNRKKQAFQDMIEMATIFERKGKLRSATRYYKLAYIYGSVSDMVKVRFRIAISYAKRGQMTRFWALIEDTPDTPGSVQRYNEYYDALGPINSVLFDMSQDSVALDIIAHLNNDKKYKKYSYILTVDSDDELPEKTLVALRRYDVTVVLRQSDRYMQYLAAVRLVVSDRSLADYYIRKDFQAYIKIVNRDISSYLKDLRGNLAMANEARQCLQASTLLLKRPSENTVIDTKGTILAVTGAKILTACNIDALDIFNVITNKLVDFDELLIRSNPKVLLYGSYGENGITSSFLNLIRQMNRSEIDVLVVADGKEMAHYKERHKVLAALPRDVITLATCGELAATEFETHAIHEFEERYNYESLMDNKLYNAAYSREARRLYGDITFDASVYYEGYRLYWASLLSRVAARRSAIYTHNDMQSEYENKYPKLEAVFRQYDEFTHIIGVSKANTSLNRENIADTYRISQDKFKYCDNIQDSHEVIRKAKQVVDARAADLFKKGRTVFVAIGRLSPEKDHYKLVQAFAVALKSHPKAHLLICGEGPERQRIERLIDDLNVKKRVHLLGFVENPYPILKNADCFVLSSNYEGQPVVLYEAMALQKPIICTNIQSTKPVIESGYGELVENSNDGIVDGIEHFMRGEFTVKPFDFTAHERRSLERFYSIVLGLEGFTTH